MFISLSQARYNVKKIGTSTVHSNIIYLYSDPFNLSHESEYVHTDRLFISAQFRSFLM